jgi:hypothetical protein
LKIIQKIKLIPSTYAKHGIDGVIYAFLKNLGFNIKYHSILDRKKEELQKKIINLTKKKIISGLYKSTKLSCDTHWGGYSLSSKLLGTYEQQVQEKIIFLKKKYALKNIINFGASDGYHVVSLVRNNFFKSGIAFEIDKMGQKILKKNIKLNKLTNKISVFGKASFEDIKKIYKEKQINETIFLVDIEGDEFSLLNSENIKYFKDSILIVENHDFMLTKKKLINNFYKIMNKNFNIEILKNSARNPFILENIKYLDDDQKWLLMSEGRPQNMNWLVCIPKKLIQWKIK